MSNQRISRNIIKSAFAKGIERELAFVIAVKRHTSTIKAHTKEDIYSKLAQITGTSKRTSRRYLKKLSELGFVSLYESKNSVYVYFRRLRAECYYNTKRNKVIKPIYQDIILNNRNTDYKTVKTILMSLRALYVLDTQRRRDFLSQTERIAHDPSQKDSIRAIKAARKILIRYRLENFSDKGMSNRFLRRLLHCGSVTLTNIIEYAESAGLFAKIPAVFEYEYIGIGEAGYALKYRDDSDIAFATHSYIVHMLKASSYKIL